MERNTLTVIETAAYLGVSKDSIYTLVRENSIPYVRVGKRILFRKETIDSWMQMQEKNHVLIYER
ncbi:helix-turn-helix domain-containing protein [Neobacillus massiliamazoniensis]|uniref:Excisionase family DNA binding domain-containing protein n=1 Tax=Neobacillus massiliamazoniensis TaxID=1499688 RepID=A0A0U1NZH3_9BACI|nr:helix-turn-helix domain-containing protein [Neobacillus massiliamazoniensis]CRK83429.1 excisionase family DNA binding domain-containing protein [Neobacillus massiliamazoniensis]